MWRNIYIKDMGNGERKVITGPCRFINYTTAYNAARRYGESNLKAKYAFGEEGELTLTEINKELHKATQDFPLGSKFIIEHDGFVGEVIGHYRTREGKMGVVLQQENTKVVHVYGTKWLKK